MTRVAQYLRETHGARFELLRHFAGTMFDSDIVSSPDEWKKAAIGFFAALVSFGLIVVKTFSERYSLLQMPPSTRLIYGRELRSDEFLFIGIAMMLTALLTLLAWQSLFPRLRDCLALAGLPVSAGEVFGAKFGAVSMVFFGYVLALNAPWALLFAIATSGPWQENPLGVASFLATFAATAGACCFTFFGLLALQGILLNILPGRRFDAVSRWIQGGLFIAVMGAAPLIGRQPHVKWWPGVWFLGLWEGIEKGHVAAALAGIGSIAAAASIAVAAYITSYHRQQRILLEARREQTKGSAALQIARAGAWLLEKWIPEPSGQAAFSFLWKTLTRSRGHRLALLAYAGLALGWIVKGALDMPAPSLRDQGVYGMLVTISPLAVALLIVIAFRYLFSLPVAPGARWMFQLEDRNGSVAWLAATERFVIWLGIAPVFAASLPAAIAILGGWRALGVTALSFLTAVLWFEARFRNWRKLPFTCSFLPAKSSAAMMLLRYALASYLLVGIGALILYCSIEPAAFVALITFQIALWWKLMRSRRTRWKDAPILYEDLPEAEVNPLELGEFTNAAANTETAPTPVREALFTASLSESRGLLPESWAEEISEEKRHAQTFLTSLLEDVRFGMRLIRRNALVSAVVVLTLTAGIGINATIFTIVNGMVLRPHIAKDPASFITITAENRATLTLRASSYSEYVAYAQARSVRNLAAWFNMGRVSFGDSDSVSFGLAVSCNFFAAEGVDRPRLGRLLVEDDCHTPGQPAVAVISESTWRDRFASDPGIIGRVVRLNNRPVPVVGVVADGTSGWTMAPAIGVWIPYTSEPWFDPSRNLFQHEEYFTLRLAGRVAPGFTREAVRAELSNITYQQDRLHPGRGTTIETTDGSWIEWLEMTMSGRTLLLTAFFFGAFNLVLFISCANVATLQLSRAAARSREIAVRLALGASRIRLMRMLVTESVLLAVLAGIASAFLMWKAPEPLCRYLTMGVVTYPLPPDWRVFSYIGIMALLTGIASGLAPAIETLRADLNSPLKGSRGWGGAGGTKRALGWLVSAQVAMSMMLLVGAGLLSQAENRNLRGSPGYDPQKVVVAPLNFGEGGSIASAEVRLEAIKNRMLALPGVRSVAFSDRTPLFFPDTIELRPPERPDAVQPVDIYTASPDFFRTLGIPILMGREFRGQDANAAIVSEALARLFWRRSSPLGKTIEFPDRSRLLVVGIAKNTEPQRFGGSDNPALYRLRQVSATFNVLAVRFDYGADKGARAARSSLRQVEPNMQVHEVQLMQTLIDTVSQELWNFVSLILVLGLIATVLSASGIYGAVSFVVGQSMKELGIRVALGATRAGIVRQVFLTGGKPVFRGLIVGLWLSVAMAAVLRKALAGAPLRIDSSDPLLYAAALMVLMVAATLAMGAPATRGAKSDPVEALRCE